MVNHHPIASLKCVDLSNPNIQESVAAVKEACMDSGIFYVINHGISDELRNEIFAESKKFFALPKTQKKKLGTDNYLRGYYQPSENYAETYCLGGGVLEDDPSNLWPPADVLPNWKETMQKYCVKAVDAGREVAKLIALALGLDANFFNHPNMIGDACQFNILHYGEQKVDDPTKAKKGTMAHTDSGLITLLTTDDIWGLKICRNKDANPQIWENVRPVKGAIIVNLGDILEILSNGTFRATVHKVEYYDERYSFAFFLMPNPDAIIECLPTCTSEENPPKHPPVTCAEHYRRRVQNLDDKEGKKDNAVA